MPTYKHLPRGRQRPHDEFRDFTYHALVWIRDNWQSALELAVVAIVAFAVVTGASSYWRHRSAAAADALYAALSRPSGSEERKRGIEEVARRYSRTPAGRRAAMELARILMDAGDYAGAEAEYKALAGKSRSQPMTMIAARR